jgi:hypothetical protein
MVSLFLFFGLNLNIQTDFISNRHVYSSEKISDQEIHSRASLPYFYWAGITRCGAWQGQQSVNVYPSFVRSQGFFISSNCKNFRTIFFYFIPMWPPRSSPTDEAVRNRESSWLANVQTFYRQGQDTRVRCWQKEGQGQIVFLPPPPSL